MSQENNSIQEAIQTLYDWLRKHDKGDFMPLLIYCLAYKGYIYIHPNPDVDCPNLLFRIEEKNYVQSKDSENFDFQKNDSMGFCYQIPDNLLKEWDEILEYIVCKFKDYLNKLDETSICNELLGVPNETDCYLSKICNYGQDLLKAFEEQGSKDLFKTGFYTLTQICSSINEHDCEKTWILRDLLNPQKNEVIYDPFAGPTLYNLISNEHFYKYIGSTYKKQDYIIGKLFFLTQEKLKNYKWSMYTPSENFTHLSDCVLLNHVFSPFNILKSKPLLQYTILENFIKELPPKSRIVFLFMRRIIRTSQIKLIRELIDNNWIDTIVHIGGGLFYILVDKNRSFTAPIKYIVFSHNGLFSKSLISEWEKSKEKAFYISNEELRLNDYNLYLNPEARSFMQLQKQTGYKKMPLHSFLYNRIKDDKPYRIPQTYISMDEPTNLYSSTYPLHPYISALNGMPITNETMTKSFIDGHCIIFPQTLGNRNHTISKLFPPLLFDDSKGACTCNAWCLYINTQLIDPEYLIGEINKYYFKEQQKYCSLSETEIPIAYFRLNFLSLYILVPDCPTSLERQKQIVSAAKWQHIQNTASIIGKDLSILSIVDDSCLEKETKLSDDKYIIKEFLGHGGFGCTYLALNKSPEYYEPTQVAVKEFFVNGYQKRNPGTNEVIPCLDKNLHLLENARKKFYREASIIKEFSDCPNIIKVFDVFDENGTTYYTMEYMENGDLCNYCKLMGQNGILEEFDAKRIIREVANALSTMHHHKFNHFDVKPSNILIDNDGHAKLIDFGTVKFFGNDATTTTCNMSSPGYSAPEMYQLKEFSPQADIYSLGATLRYMLEGDATHADCSGFSQPKSTIPTRLKALIDQCLDNEPSCRPKDIEDFLKRLDCC